jgi:hypothetical protein
LIDQQLGGLITWLPAAMMSSIGLSVVLYHMLHDPSPVPQPAVAE